MAETLKVIGLLAMLFFLTQKNIPQLQFLSWNSVWKKTIFVAFFNPKN